MARSDQLGILRPAAVEKFNLKVEFCEIGQVIEVFEKTPILSANAGPIERLGEAVFRSSQQPPECLPRAHRPDLASGSPC